MEKFYIIKFDNNSSDDTKFRSWDYGFFFRSKEAAETFLKENGYTAYDEDFYSNSDITYSIERNGFEFGAIAKINTYTAHPGNTSE